MGEEGWDAGHVDRLSRIFVIGRVVGAVCQVFFALRGVVTLSQELSDHEFQEVENWKGRDGIHAAFNSPHSRSGDVQHRIVGCLTSRLWRL